MNIQFKIIELVKSPIGSLYSIKFCNEEKNEFQKFLDDPDINSFPDDLQRLTNRLNDMLNRQGFRDNFFKLKESKRSDKVVALRQNKIRLYCCKYENTILILGSGGVKTTRTYQEDPKLFKKVQIMAKVSDLVEKQISDRELKIIDNEFIGDLNFE